MYSEIVINNDTDEEVEEEKKNIEIHGNEFKNMVISAGASIQSNQKTINDLNVFPVPDGDTGSNMSMTIGSAVNDLKKVNDPGTLGDVAAKTASAMLRGARGNSGVILSLLFRGMSKHLKNVEVCDAKMWAQSLKAGVEAAYGAVTSPAEGTILTVSRLAADSAIKAAEENNNFEYVMDAACNAGIEALANTINQNPVLKKAGVVDAGGMGWVLALEAMQDALHGNIHEITSEDEDGDAPIETSEESHNSEEVGVADFTDFNTEDIKFQYCTEFIVSRENDNEIPPLREYLTSIGDSIVLVDDDEIIKVHVHTNEPGNVLQKALTYGSFISVKVENMKLQHSEKIGHTIEAKKAAEEKAAKEKAKEEEETPAFEESKDYGLVAVSPGKGISEVFKSLGVDVTVSGGQTMNPSTNDILSAIEKINAPTIFVLPNNKNIIMAAQQAAEICDKQVVVIPTTSIPEGIASLQKFDNFLSAEEITRDMTEGAKDADSIQITYAARDSEFDGLTIKAGEYLALYNRKLAGNSSNIDELVDMIANRAYENEKEIITVYYGSDVNEEDAEKVASRFYNKFDEENVMLINGGQPVYYYIISAE